MNVLGIHKDPWHNTGAAIVQKSPEGTRIANLAEERLDRVKDSRAFPALSTRACMDELGISSFDEIDLVVVDYIRNSDDWRKDHFKTSCTTDNFLADLPEEKIVIVNHHDCHAHATFYSSKFERAAILVIDGRGSDSETQSLYIGDINKGIELVDKTDCLGIGLLYAAVTQAIGFGSLQEGKTMGLAPYGRTPGKRFFQFSGCYEGLVTDYSDICIEGNYELKKPLPADMSYEENASAAFEVQQECERALLHLAEYAKNKTGCDYLCLSGGVALNSVGNYKILQAEIFKDIFINPAASDTGIPIGAALLGFHRIKGQPKDYQEISPYLGPSYSRDVIKSAIAQEDGYRVIDDGAFEQAAEILKSNHILGSWQGRSEMGPRALGNRSILMSPLLPENKDTLNARVKFREPFRPFAPAMLYEHYQEYFEIDRESPYMLFVPAVVPAKAESIPAVIHVDGTGRLQTVKRDFNPMFYALIESFYKSTGVPVLLNTSFNVAGEPIVETPEDAIRCFLGTNIDALLLDDILLIKEGI